LPARFLLLAQRNDCRLSQRNGHLNATPKGYCTRRPICLEAFLSFLPALRQRPESKGLKHPSNAATDEAHTTQVRRPKLSAGRAFVLASSQRSLALSVGELTFDCRSSRLLGISLRIAYQYKLTQLRRAQGPGASSLLPPQVNPGKALVRLLLTKLARCFLSTRLQPINTYYRSPVYSATKSNSLSLEMKSNFSLLLLFMHILKLKSHTFT
jgi:hypothetical protein